MSTQEWLIVYGISLVSGIVVLVLLFVLFAKANKDLTPTVAVSFGIVLVLAEIGLNALYVRYGHIGLPGFAGLALVLLATSALGLALLVWRLSASPLQAIFIMGCFLAVKAVCAVQLSAHISPKLGIYGPKLVSAWSQPPAWRERSVDQILLSLPENPVVRTIVEPPFFKGMEVGVYPQRVDFGEYVIDLYVMRADKPFDLDSGAKGLLGEWRRIPGVDEFVEQVEPTQVLGQNGRALEGSFRQGSFRQDYRAVLFAIGSRAWAVRISGSPGPVARISDRVLPSITVEDLEQMLAQAAEEAAEAKLRNARISAEAAARQGPGMVPASGGIPGKVSGMGAPVDSPLAPRTKSGKARPVTLQTSQLEPAPGMAPSNQQSGAEKARALAAYPVARVIRSLDGKSVQASILGRSATSVRFLGAEGKEYRFPIINLSPADREFVRSLPVSE